MVGGDGRLRRAAYGAGFVAVLPAGLLLWARGLDETFPLSGIRAPLAGAGVGALGLGLMTAGITTLWRIGGRPPMNPFPQRRLVRTGVFRWIDNPIYLGFGLVALGVSLATGSGAGLWLVTPIVGLGATALVLGYERRDLVRRFGPAALEPPRLALPAAADGRTTWTDRVAVYLRVLLPWLVAYFAVQALGRAPDVFVTSLAFERGWRVIQWTEALYASTYLFVPLTPLLIVRRADLRRFAVQGLVATVLVTLTWLVVPVIADNRGFVPHGVFGRLLAFEQRSSRGVAAFPAFHVLWALIAAQGWRGNAQATGRPLWGWVGTAWAAAILVSTLTTAMHTVIEVAGAILFYLPIRRLDHTWQRIRAGTERIANSWREWRLGPVRLIDHGLYAALAAGIGLLVAVGALGPEGLGPAVTVGLGILLGAGLLAQWLEGSSRLLRPFGWYGGVIGGVLGAALARLEGAAMVPLLASFAVAAPWIQILGRLRCLVQGCCHGGPAGDRIGIRYHHRRSRVTQLAGLAGVPIHATPLYSIAGNLVIGLLLVRLRVLGAPDPLVLGGYLMLGGMARFVEEAYRAEPQTPVLGGLRLYQWLGIASLLAGILCTLLPGPGRPAGFAFPNPATIVAALGMALLTGFLMGVDFPGSNRRFSRLAPAD